MAAEVLGSHGYAVDIFDRMPTPARKFLMAGKSGLNITHSEELDMFVTRYDEKQLKLESSIRAFSARDIQAWMDSLGCPSFIGSTGRIFPKAMKASPLLRSWIKRLEQYGARLFMRHDWCGWSNDGALIFDTPDGQKIEQYTVTILALGGASWQRLGSDGRWVKYLDQWDIQVAPFKSANCGLNVDWTDHMKKHFSGSPVKNICLSVCDSSDHTQKTQGDLMLTGYGIEGGPVYTLSRFVRERLLNRTEAILSVDLMPDRSFHDLQKALNKPRGKKSFSTFLKRAIGLDKVKMALLHECWPKSLLLNNDMDALANAIKSTPVFIKSVRPIEEAISSAGGLCFSNLDENLMVIKKPGLFCAGEMVDWEAPTGGYLITACLAQGRQAAMGVINWADDQKTV